MKVIDLFKSVALKPLGPVKQFEAIEELEQGVYVLARVSEPTANCEPSPFSVYEFLPECLIYDYEYEERRWLSHEPVVYIGATDGSLQARIDQLNHHSLRKPGPHRDGQAHLLLDLPLWLYWSPVTNPYLCRWKMIEAFKKLAGQAPYANCAGKEWEERVRLGPKPRGRKSVHYW